MGNLVFSDSKFLMVWIGESLVKVEIVPGRSGRSGRMMKMTISAPKQVDIKRVPNKALKELDHG